MTWERENYEHGLTARGISLGRGQTYGARANNECWKMTLDELSQRPVTSMHPRFPFQWRGCDGVLRRAKDMDGIAKLREDDFERHKQIVRKALREGELVPKKVLDDYPELVTSSKPVSERREATLTPNEDHAWVFAFDYYISGGYTDDQSDYLAWRDLQLEFPRLKRYDGIKE